MQALHSVSGEACIAAPAALFLAHVLLHRGCLHPHSWDRFGSPVHHTQRGGDKPTTTTRYRATAEHIVMPAAAPMHTSTQPLGADRV